jgi:type I restriction enzyme, S subunit
MEVRPGYKQTEVGVIPDEWEVSTVGQEFAVQLGKMLDAEKNVGVSKPYLGNKAVQWDRIDVSDLPTVPMSRSDLDKFRLQKGDLLVCEGGEVGRAALWDAPLAECYYQKALHRLRPLREFDARLLVAILCQWSKRGILANYVTQTSIAHLPREKFVEMPIPRPPLPEQRAIATALSDVDALLGGLDRLIAKKRDLKQAAMQQLLTGKTRLPGFHGEWEVKRLGELCSMKSGEGITAKDIDEVSPFRCYGGNGLRGFTTRFTHEGSYCLIGRVGALCGNVLQVEGQFFASEHAVVVTAFESVDVSWLTLALGMIGLNRRAESSAQPVLTVSKLLPLEVLAPSTKVEQAAIAAVLSDMDAEIEALEARRAKTRDLKQAMMQELLTGTTRLVPPEATHA